MIDREDVILGKGSFGCVVRVARKDDGKVFACKKSVFKDGNLRPDQRNEVDALLKKYNSPFIVKLWDYFYSNKKICLIIDYCSDESLREKITTLQSKRKPFSEQETLYFLAQMIHGVAALHKKKIIHCDLKPENILFFGDTTIRIGMKFHYTYFLSFIYFIFNF